MGGGFAIAVALAPADLSPWVWFWVAGTASLAIAPIAQRLARWQLARRLNRYLARSGGGGR